LEKQPSPRLKERKKSAGRLPGKKKLIFLSGLFAVMLMSGLAAVYYVGSLEEAPDININKIKRERAANRAAQAAQSEAKEHGSKLPVAEKAAINTAESKTAEPAPPAESSPKTKNTSLDENIPAQAASGDEEALKAKVKHFSTVLAEDISVSKKVQIKKTSTPAPKKQVIDTAQRDSYLYSARAHELKKDFNSALADYRKVLETDSDNFIVMNNIAFIYLQQGLVNESIRYSQTALSVKEDYIPALINLGIASATEGNIAAAEEHFGRVIALDPGSQAALLNLAVLHERQEEYSHASGFYEKLMKVGSGPGALGLARSYEKLGRLNDAVGVYRSIQTMESAGRAAQTTAGQRIMLLLNTIKNEQ
jgi:tetratricopeptide (TPR) repeat protein